jgi:hypothetical protein
MFSDSWCHARDYFWHVRNSDWAIDSAQTAVLWNAVHDHGVGHRLDDTHAIDPPCDADCQAFPRELIDQCHQPDLAAVMGLCFDKVVGSHMVAPLRSQPDARTVIEP